MSLHAVQCALAELFTDGGARERFAQDAGEFSTAHGLDEREREQLAALSAAAIASYAATLVRKRRAEAARLLPRTRAALGDGFASTYAAWAERTALPAGGARYARDATAFAAHVLAGSNVDSGARAAIRRDRAALRASLRPVWIKWLP